MMRKHQETLILLPGLLSDATIWKHQMKHLQDICRIVIPDFTSCQSLADTLHVILENAPNQFMLAGHSMGGWLALEIMRHHPQRVSKLCLLSTSADIDSAEKKQRRLHVIQQVKMGEIAPVIDTIIHDFVYQGRVKLDVKTMFLHNQKAFIHQQEMMLQRATCMDFLPNFTLSPMLIVGGNDSEFHPEMVKIKQFLPQSKLALIEDCGHMAPMEMPQAVTALMRLWIEFL